MMRREDELEAFKTRINLTAYAAAAGYELDRKASSRNSALMKRGPGDKIVIVRNHNGHWTYFSVGDDRDNGSIVDFVQNRKGCSLGHVRKELRPWLEAPESRVAEIVYVEALEPASKDIAAVRALYEAMTPISGSHPYLESARKIPAGVLADPRFHDRIRIDDRGNAIFPHWNREGLCGYEIKNRGFTGFARGGEKGLWCSRVGERDDALVLAETAIDALSYAALKGTANTRFFSIAGELNKTQPDLITLAVGRMKPGSRIVLALDNDDGGRGLLEKIRAILGDLGHAGRVLEVAMPLGEGKDWNDALRISMSEVGPTP